jgi:hypothetical protein
MKLDFILENINQRSNLKLVVQVKTDYEAELIIEDLLKQGYENLSIIAVYN